MSDTPQTQPPGWYYAQGDPPGTQRYWDGQKWEGGPQPVPGAGADVAAGGAQNLAEPLMRIGARVIDYIIWAIVSIIVTLIFAGSVLATGADDDVSFAAAFLAGIIGVGLITAYETFLVGSRGQTLGKMALGIKVVRMDGSPPDMKDGFMRILPYTALGVLGSIIPFVGLISFIVVLVSLVFLFTDENRQTVWDKVAKTIVVPA